jgi:hypothetical protein
MSRKMFLLILTDTLNIDGDGIAHRIGGIVIQ